MQQAGKALVKGQTILPLYCCSKQEGVCLCRSTENMKMEPRTWSMVTEMGKNNSYCKGAIFSNKNVFLFQQNVKLYILIYIWLIYHLVILFIDFLSCVWERGGYGHVRKDDFTEKKGTNNRSGNKFPSINTLLCLSNTSHVLSLLSLRTP